MKNKDSNSRQIFPSDFPESLQKSIHCPKSLFIKGTLPDKNTVGVALVGTRRPSVSAPLLCDFTFKVNGNKCGVHCLAQGLIPLHEQP